MHFFLCCVWIKKKKITYTYMYIQPCMYMCEYKKEINKKSQVLCFVKYLQLASVIYRK
uniref:Uncharacterized protein n=1 Tax=Anguilla anguilla TaxID=7936 RepID=A0A0E9TR28_ANGAN